VNKYTVTECSYEQKTREVPYTVCVPKTETRNEQVTTYECRAVPKTETYTVMVQQCVQKEIEVEVCHMVAQTVQVPCQSSCCPAPSCGCESACGECCGGCHHRCHRRCGC
jgi:hypothetical protein